MLMLPEQIVDVANNVSSTAMVCRDNHYCRTVPSIIISCASTIFLCTWVALHPDVPTDPYASWWKMPIRPIIENRVVSTFAAFLAPELILYFSFEDWLGSCSLLVYIMKEYPECQWTETHAQLQFMRGFQIVNEDGTSYRLDINSSIPESHLHILKIPVEEIEDKSKADFIAKTIAIIQTLWFVLQIINRAIQGLTVTELEFTTLAHTVLNLFIYWCWWNKPVNIRFPFKVYPTTEETSDLQNDKGEPEEQTDTTSEAERQMHPGQLSIRVRLGAYICNVGSRSRLASLIVTMCESIIPALFGAIHCLAWNAQFPTSIESRLWRASAVIVTVAPPLILWLYVVWNLSTMDWRLGLGLSGVVIVPYVLARICLLTLALSTLRALPYSAYLIPSWTRYVPHI